jgi:hypothetical protein
MKNVTLFSIMFLISFGLSAQSSSELRKKIQQKQEKLSVITLKDAKLKRLLKLTSSETILKSAAATQKLDSTVNRVFNEVTQLWQNDYKDEYFYNTEMKNTSWLEKEWNVDTKTWEIWSRTVLGYDNKSRVNSMLMYERDEITQAIEQVSKILVYNDSEGIQDSLSMYSSENNGVTWVLEMKQINHYNEAKKLIKTDIWSIDEDLGEFVLSMNIVNTYTASGKLKTSNMNMLFEGYEMPWSITEYNYDGSGKITSIEYSTLNFMTFEMEKSSRITYQYNASGGRTVEINSKWNGSTWVDEDKSHYEYNSAGDVSVEIHSGWNGTAWMEEWKDEYIFSTTNFSEVAFPQFDFITNVLSSFLNLFGINESFEFSYNKLITGTNYFEMINGSWKNTDKTTFYYSGGTSTNIAELPNTLFTVYPNPAVEQVNFSWKGNYESLSLQIYQITGARVTEQTVYSGKPVSISKLENGVYFFKLLNGKQMVHTGKMIKR